MECTKYQYITVQEAASEFSDSENAIRRDLRLGRVAGKKVGNRWFVAIPSGKIFNCK